MSFVTTEVNGLDGEFASIKVNARQSVIEIETGSIVEDGVTVWLDADAAVQFAEAILEAVKEIRS